MKESDLALAEARVKALAWVERGMPDEEIEYDDDAPELIDEQLSEFKSASVSFIRNC